MATGSYASRPPICTHATIVILPDGRVHDPSVFRRIEMVADLLAQELEREQLTEVYELFEESEACWPTPA